MLQAKDYLKNDVTLVVVKDDQAHTFYKHGISPVLDLLSKDPQLLNGSSVADKIIGKASCLLLIKGQIKELYAEVLSKKAIPLLEKYHIPFQYHILTDHIINRENTGICPMEMTVENIDNPMIAEEKLREKLKELTTD